MASLITLTLDVEEQIFGQTPEERPAVDTLATAVTNSTDTTWRFTLAGTQFWERGDFAEYVPSDGTAGEIIRFSADHSTAGADVSVLRAQKRTTAAASFAGTELFQKNPKHNRTEIQRVINAVVDEDLQHGIWYRSARTLAWETGRVHYELNAADFEVERMYQHDLSATAAVGTSWSYDETGGAAEDLWTSTAAHGLSVGDAVRFTTAGTNATGYAANVVYWVAAAPTTTTATFSATEDGSAIAGTTDGSGWILEKIISFSVREFPPEWYKKMIPVATTLSSTGRSLLVHRVYDDTRTVHYTAKTHPASTAISSLPAEIAGMIPWGVLARLTGGTAVRGRYPGSGTETSGVAYADASFFLNTFHRLRDQYREKLRAEHEKPRGFVYGPVDF